MTRLRRTAGGLLPSMARRCAWSGVVLLALAGAAALPLRAQVPGSTLEQQVEGATDPGMEGGSLTPLPDETTEDTTAGAAPAAPAPRDPSKGAVTNLPIPRFVTLKGSEGNARRGPGLTHRIDWVFTREGMPLKVTAEYEHWRRVEDVDGAGGWIHYSLLSGVRSVLVTQDMAEAFDDPSEGADPVYQSERGVIGKLLQCLPSWCRVQIEGEKGWMRKAALWGVDPNEVYP